MLGATTIVGLFGATGASIGMPKERVTQVVSDGAGGGVVSLQRNRIHRALSRPNLLMGADRELVLITGLAAVILIFVVLTVYSVLFGVAVWIVIVGLLRMMAKSDPLMRQVYARHISYKAHYRPTASPWRKY